MSEPRLPQFIIIGAVKAATTWIAHQLRQHPDIYLPGRSRIISAPNIIGG
jgi:hypothetical protein